MVSWYVFWSCFYLPIVGYPRLIPEILGSSLFIRALLEYHIVGALGGLLELGVAPLSVSYSSSDELVLWIHTIPSARYPHMSPCLYRVQTHRMWLLYS
ncbi:hypothetical protein BD311DRAFT_767611 [Dichomitus squalens]|uniref:Uncharacterized protein n=1 Tax=Dichomitus squalens TaxID=114155 RepID=A0A4V2JZ65_9APHY|nr:hypothetical protein BD311DRAFT_767611 [Dichomitus squalens]